MKTEELTENQIRITASPAVYNAWHPPPEDLRLEVGEAHVWLARLDEETAAESERLISDDERNRAERFRFERDKKRFIAARGFLRVILGKYLRTNPRRIHFEYSKYGKPFLGRELQSSIKFNLSHSDGLALYAVTDGREIGIDIERIKSSFVDETMASQCLTKQEIVRFRLLPKKERDLFFFDCWTRKEAYLKARGNGLLLPVNEIETSLSSEFLTSFLQTDSASRQTSGSFQILPSIPDYAAALAVEGRNPQLKFWLPSTADLPW
ncbi:MAG: 4'-phosphopantetheinyl transferase superfamily protein [Pyrinomonadaceae bacterium]|nr:4'-phosphopantetheinyl transferase superfamily protein [Pyrinomonadaceae bacterium]